MDLFRLGAREIAAGIRDGRWRAVHIARAHAARIEARDRDVRAWTHLDLERAGRSAESLDAGDAARGALCGVPVAVKDIIDVAGMPTRFGSPIYDDAAPAAQSAECV